MAGFDPPIALGNLCGYGALQVSGVSQFLIVGELGRDGSAGPIPGMLPVAIIARKEHSKSDSAGGQCGRGYSRWRRKRLSRLVTARRHPAAQLPSCRSHSARTLSRLNRGSGRPAAAFRADFKDVRRRHTAMRALEIAAAGSHNIVTIGPPGSGKTMLDKRLPSILAPLIFEEALESTKIGFVA
jgi:magnesium chelatase family protein